MITVVIKTFTENTFISFDNISDANDLARIAFKSESVTYVGVCDFETENVLWSKIKTDLIAAHGN